MTVKAMFFVKDIHHHLTQDPSSCHADIVLGAAFGTYLKDLPGGEEVNKDWSKYTPSGEVKMTITNPEAVSQFELGGVYELRFERVA